MNINRLPDYLEHIQQAANNACSFVEGIGKEDFLDDLRTQQAVTMNILIIGEASTNILSRYSKFAQATPHIPWREMKNMRNRIAHGYFEINLHMVWDTVQQDLPKLLAQLPVIQQTAQKMTDQEDEAETGLQCDTIG